MSTPLVNLWQVDQFYSVDGLQHVQRYYLNPAAWGAAPGNPPADYDIILRDGTFQPLDLAIARLQGLLANFLSDQSTVQRADVFRVTANQQQRDYITQQSGGIPGDLASAPILGQQITLTYRTFSGRWAKFTALETPNGNYGKFGYAPVNPPQNPQQAFANYLTTPSEMALVDREGTYGYSPIFVSITTNDALWETRYGVG